MKKQNDNGLTAKQDTDNTVMSPKECAAYLNVCKETILRQARAKEIPHFRVGRCVLFRKEVIDEWIAKQEADNSVNAQSQPQEEEISIRPRLRAVR